jgi:type IV pilus assembly protein PilM
MQLTRKKKTDTVAGLEIEAGSVAATELTVNGNIQISGSGVEPLAPGAFHEGEVADPDLLVDALKSLFSRHKLSKQVRVGIANQGVVVRSLRLPAIEDPKELDAAVRFQAQEQIPMPLDQAVLEHQVVGGVPAEEGAQPQIDVVVVAARRDMVSALLQPIRRAGLEPVGVDLSAFAMIRALADVVLPTVDPEQGETRPTEGAVLYCSLADVTNIAVARRRACFFTRVSYTGLGSIAERLTASHGLSPEHARQWLSYVGLEAPAGEIEGDPAVVGEARAALEAGIAALIDDLRLSLDYYGAQEGAVPIERVAVCGPGGSIAGCAARMEAGLGLPVTSVRPQALSGFDESTAARLTLPYGLALEH